MNITLWLISIVAVFTVFFLLILKYTKENNIDEKDIDKSLDVTKLLAIFIKSILKDKAEYNKVDLYCEIIIDSIEYIKVLNSDLTKTDKIIHGMQNVLNVAEDLNIELKDEDINMLRNILYIVYDFYLSVENSKLK